MYTRKTGRNVMVTLVSILGLIIFVLCFVPAARSSVGFWFSQPIVWIWLAVLLQVSWCELVVLNGIYLLHKATWYVWPWSTKMGLALAFLIISEYIGFTGMFASGNATLGQAIYGLALIIFLIIGGIFPLIWFLILANIRGESDPIK